MLLMFFSTEQAEVAKSPINKSPLSACEILTDIEPAVYQTNQADMLATASAKIGSEFKTF